MKKTILAAGVALASVVGFAANAASVSITNYANQAAINTAFAAKTASGAVIENFETGFTGGQLGPISTAVGTFSGFGTGVGSGSTCGALDGPTCGKVAIQDSRPRPVGVGQINNQGNVIPLGGFFSLNSADTSGVTWDVSLGGASFTSVIFALRDAADQRGSVWSVASEDASGSFSFNQGNGNLKLVTIDFGEARTSAQVRMSTNINDAFTIDGAAITGVSPVPVPAALPLLLAAFGGLGFLRSRKKRAA